MGERINIVLAGHVDHGKSTIVGRLLADSGALPDGKLAQVKAYCARNAKPFEYAFLVDALKNEQTQGVTIDSARVFLRLGGRDYVLIDAPGHIEFIRNMVTGAARADAALLVVDANEGIQENSRRHGALLALLGIQQVVVLVNKMDLVSFRSDIFENIKVEFSEFLTHWGIRNVTYIPVSGIEGENIIARSARMPWFKGATVVEALGAFTPSAGPSDAQFRMWVQDVYKFTNDGDTRRIVAGTIESGSVRVGDRVIFHPSGKKSTVASIEGFNIPKRETATSTEAVGFTLTEQVYVARGELATNTTERHPRMAARLRVSLFWLATEPMVMGADYLMKIGTARVRCTLEAIHNVQDGSSLELRQSDRVGRHQIADCDLRLAKAIAFDLIDEVPATGRFVIVDRYEIRGGGIIRRALEDRQTKLRDKVLLRDYKWESSTVTAEERAEKFGQRPALIIVTGEQDSGKKPLARALEAELLTDGHAAYFIGIANVLYGVDADILGAANNRAEHMRRLAEVVHILLSAGFIAIVTAIGITKEDLEIIDAAVGGAETKVVWVGSNAPKDGKFMAILEAHADAGMSARSLKLMLVEGGILLK